MKYETVIFDLDGTLLDTISDLHQSVNHALAANGLPQRSLNEIKAFVGNGISNLIKRAVPKGTEEELTERVFSRFKEHYKLHSRDKTAPYPGVSQLIDKLLANGIKLGVVSNKAHFAVADIMSFYFGERIEVCLGEREGVSRKPSPDAVFEAMRLLGGGRALYVGDSEVDVATAENAGIDSVMVTWGFRSREQLLAAGAKRLAETAEELYEIITEGDNAYTAE